VLLVTNLYPTPVEPTRGIFIHQLAKRLRALCDVTVVCPLPWFPALPLPRVAARWRAFSGVPAEYTIDGVEVYSPKYPLLPRVSEGIHASLMRSTLSGAIARLHAKHRFDVINAQWLYPDGVAATRIGERLGIPVVLSALGSDVNVFVTEPRKWKQISRSLRSSAAITTVSRDLKQRLVAESVPESRITAVLNGADHDLFRPMPKEECRARLGIDPRLKAIVFVGRLVPIKGIGHLVDAAARLAQRRQDFAVHLVGDGHLRAACEADIRARGLGERVKLVGARSHAEIPVWMGACDAFCLPSLAEGCPNVVLEALFSGRPVVASRTGGIPEMVGPQNGVLVEPGDAAALADGLDRALSRSWDAAAVRDSVMHLTWEAAAQGYHEVFVSVSHPRAA
jgi:glycosyltransferase involved in cell wall biosynthesis